MVEVDRGKGKWLAPATKIAPGDRIVERRVCGNIICERDDDSASYAGHRIDDACEGLANIAGLAVVVVSVHGKQDLGFYLTEAINDAVNTEVR